MEVKIQENDKMLISIIIATYNRADYIGKTLDSILDQTYPHYEIIIVDDGGSDNTQKVLEPFLKRVNISFFKRSKEFLKGCPGSRNFGLSKAKGEYIWFFDDDDIAHPRLLETCASLLKKDNYDFCRFERTVFYDFDEINFEIESSPENFEVSRGNLKQLIIGELPFNSCQIIWNRASLGDNNFREDIIYADDWEFYSRLLAKELKGITVDYTLLFARKHAGSATHKYKNKNKNIIQSVTKANISVINLAAKENIIDKQLFKFFFRQAITFNSYPVLKQLLNKTNLDFFSKMKYKLGYLCYPVIKPFFNLKSKFLKP